MSGDALVVPHFAFDLRNDQGTSLRVGKFEPLSGHLAKSAIVAAQAPVLVTTMQNRNKHQDHAQCVQCDPPVGHLVTVAGLGVLQTQGFQYTKPPVSRVTAFHILLIFSMSLLHASPGVLGLSLIHI